MVEHVMVSVQRRTDVMFVTVTTSCFTAMTLLMQKAESDKLVSH